MCYFFLNDSFDLEVVILEKSLDLKWRSSMLDMFGNFVYVLVDFSINEIFYVGMVSKKINNRVNECLIEYFRFVKVVIVKEKKIEVLLKCYDMIEIIYIVRYSLFDGVVIYVEVVLIDVLSINI